MFHGDNVQGHKHLWSKHSTVRSTHEGFFPFVYTYLWSARFCIQASMNLVLMQRSMVKHTRAWRAFSASVSNPSGSLGCKKQWQTTSSEGAVGTVLLWLYKPLPPQWNPNPKGCPELGQILHVWLFLYSHEYMHTQCPCVNTYSAPT